MLVDAAESMHEWFEAAIAAKMATCATSAFDDATLYEPLPRVAAEWGRAQGFLS